MNNDFYIRKINQDNIKKVLHDVGFDEKYIDIAASKYKHILIKIHNLSCPEANILKQLALSAGADAAVHREVITCKVGKSDVVLGCTQAQLKIISKKLQHQPFRLKNLASLLLDQIQYKEKEPLNIRDTIFNWSKKTYIMGILNVTPDSFSDGGKYLNIDAAVSQALRMIDDGADIIDIGGESTRPFADEVSAEEESRRVVPVIEAVRKVNASIVISVDTRHSTVAKEAINNGADIINDVSGLDFDQNMIDTISELQVPVIIMHSLSDPKNMQVNPVYSEDVIDAIAKSLYDKTQRAIKAGIKKENIILDPGIGFGKNLLHNLEIIKRVGEFKSIGYPLLVGISRKSFISKIIDLPIDEREEANIALNSYLASNGANILRVHDVKSHYKALKVLDKIIR